MTDGEPDLTVLRHPGEFEPDSTVLRPSEGGGDHTVLRPAEPPSDHTVLRPAEPPSDHTVLRPAGPPSDHTVLRPAELVATHLPVTSLSSREDALAKERIRGLNETSDESGDVRQEGSDTTALRSAPSPTTGYPTEHATVLRSALSPATADSSPSTDYPTPDTTRLRKSEELRKSEDVVALNSTPRRVRTATSLSHPPRVKKAVVRRRPNPGVKEPPPVVGDPWSATRLPPPPGITSRIGTPPQVSASTPVPMSSLVSKVPPAGGGGPVDAPTFDAPVRQEAVAKPVDLNRPTGEAQAPELDVPKPIPGAPIDAPSRGRYSRPDEAPSHGRARRRRRPVWLLGAVGAIVLGLVGYLVWDQYRPIQVDPSIVVPTTAQASKAVVARGDQVVREYLTALKDGDIDKALTYGPVGPGSTVLLNQATVRRGLDRAPIGSINVPTADENASQIRASYTIGTEAVEAVFRVVKNDDGSWHLAKATTTVHVSAKRNDRVPLSINGQVVGPVVDLELVPGSYAFDTTLPYLAYHERTNFTVPNLDYGTPIEELPVVITPQGREALIQATNTSLDQCLSSQELSPVNCPFRFPLPPGRQIVPGSIHRTLDLAEPAAVAQWAVSPSDFAVAEALVTVKGSLTATYTNGDTTGASGFNDTWTVTIDATRSRPQDLTVRWSK